MDVDPEALRQFSNVVDDLAQQVAASPIPADFESLAALLPGSTTAYAAQTTADEMRPQLAGVSTYFDRLSGAVYNAAGGFESTDTVLADKFTQLPGPRRAS
ncbi:hypothetical protein ACLQ3C_04330 [Gordonia sp. DT30]|uniref:hypothetical protein n=1 Tax=Gordonia sp. DT30 TaxID=3416546 RepID=UPI003CE73CA7